MPESTPTKPRNRAKCANCGDIIESLYRHDFQWCQCQTIFIDGGTDYCRGGGDLSKFIVVKEDGTEEPLNFTS